MTRYKICQLSISPAGSEVTVSLLTEVPKVEEIVKLPENLPPDLKPVLDTAMGALKQMRDSFTPSMANVSHVSIPYEEYQKLGLKLGDYVTVKLERVEE